MKIVGLNETLLRSMINSSQSGYSGLSFEASLFLYRESTNDNFSSLNIDLSTANFNANFAKLAASAHGIMLVRLTFVKEGGKVKIKMAPHATTNLFSAADEVFHIGLSSRSVYDIQAAATQTLGSCLVYKPNNLDAVTGTTSISAPAVLTKGERWSSPAELTRREGFTEKEVFSFGSAPNLHIGRRHYSGLSYAGAAAVVFTSTVEADFMYMDLKGDGNVIVNRNLSLELLNTSNQWVSLGSFVGQVNTQQRFNFTKQQIKGMRLLSPFDSIEANHFCLYYLQAFTAGLKDFASSPLNNPTRTNWTKAVIALNLNTTDIQQPHRLPLMTLSVGNTASSRDLKLSTTATSSITNGLFAEQTILELEI